MFKQPLSALIPLTKGELKYKHSDENRGRNGRVWMSAGEALWSSKRLSQRCRVWQACEGALQVVCACKGAMWIRESAWGYANGRHVASADRLRKSGQVGQTYPSGLWPFLPASPLTFWERQQGNLQTVTKWLQVTATSCVNQLPSTRLWSHDHVGARRAGIPRTTYNHHSFSTVIILNSCWTNGDWLKTICIGNRISEQLCMNLFLYCSYVTVCWWQNLQVKGTTKFSLLAIKDRQICIRRFRLPVCICTYLSQTC